MLFVVWIPSANIHPSCSSTINSIKRANTPTNYIAAPENAPTKKGLAETHSANAKKRPTGTIQLGENSATVPDTDMRHLTQLSISTLGLV